MAEEMTLTRARQIARRERSPADTDELVEAYQLLIDNDMMSVARNGSLAQMQRYLEQGILKPKTA